MTDKYLQDGGLSSAMLRLRHHRTAPQSLASGITEPKVVCGNEKRTQSATPRVALLLFPCAPSVSKSKEPTTFTTLLERQMSTWMPECSTRQTLVLTPAQPAPSRFNESSGGLAGARTTQRTFDTHTRNYHLPQQP